MSLQSRLQQLSDMDDGDENSNRNNDGSVFESLVVLDFSLRVPPPSIQWIMEKIKLSKSKGGAELLVCPIVDENHEVRTAHAMYF